MSIVNSNSLRVIVLCTVSTGLDAIAEVMRNGFTIEGIVGLNPKGVDLDKISGFIDVAPFANKWGIKYFYVQSYELHSSADQDLFRSLIFNFIWVAGWQRLIPKWLIALAQHGAVGGHGSPDGISGGRGRSPQNWAIILGCRRFDLALFKIALSVDDGPIIMQRTFFYSEVDDIAISYKKVALCMGEMVVEVLKKPSLLAIAIPQNSNPFYYPQRNAEDGYVDWNQSQKTIWAYCRALTHPYPGLRTRHDKTEIIIWDCLPFDDAIKSTPGTIDFVFEDGCFLVSCQDGRVLIRNIFSHSHWEPTINWVFFSQSQSTTLNKIIIRHSEKNPNFQIAPRIMNSISLED